MCWGLLAEVNTTRTPSNTIGPWRVLVLRFRVEICIMIAALNEKIIANWQRDETTRSTWFQRVHWLPRWLLRSSNSHSELHTTSIHFHLSKRLIDWAMTQSTFQVNEYLQKNLSSFISINSCFCMLSFFNMCASLDKTKLDSVSLVWNLDVSVSR